jgi:toxin YoeB
MAQKRIAWSIEARNDLIKIFEFYNDRNASNKYSIKLNQKIQHSLLTISKNPNVGIKTSP